jgi:hypothetical protein
MKTRFPQVITFSNAKIKNNFDSSKKRFAYSPLPPPSSDYAVKGRKMEGGVMRERRLFLVG